MQSVERQGTYVQPSEAVTTPSTGGLGTHADSRAAHPAPAPDSYERPRPLRAHDPYVKLIAFYLPQFHPIPENDRWWGEGFTEWRNVTRAAPLFDGHYQPRLPGALGFYDLRLKEVMQRQIDLARQFGIHGFCFHHYWFGGRRLLERPVEQLLADPQLAIPFCLCWANENWTRRWDGWDQDILIAHEHSAEDDLAFIADLLRYFHDPRYIRVDGKPLLLVYRPQNLPDPAATVDRWRAHCATEGLQLYCVAAQTFGQVDPRAPGFDAAVQFPPHHIGLKRIPKPGVGRDFQGEIYDYEEWSREYLRPDTNDPTYPLFRCVSPGWDNTARRGPNALIFADSTPDKYARWLEAACLDICLAQPPQRRLVFVNAWNEWAEAAYLEPDLRYGYAYLNRTAAVLERIAGAGDPAAMAERRAALAACDGVADRPRVDLGATATTLAVSAPERTRWRHSIAVPATATLGEVRRFWTRQRGSLRKRRAEVRELLMRAAVRLHPTHRLKELRKLVKLVRRSHLFDQQWYRARYRGIVPKTADPILHYLRYGLALGCEPNPSFSSRGYLKANPVAAAVGINPLVHYIVAQGVAEEHAALSNAGQLGAGPDDGACASGTDHIGPSSPAHPRPSAFEHASWAAAEASHDDAWGAYDRLRAQMSALEHQRLAELQVAPCTLIRVDPENVATHIATMGFPAVANPLVSVIVPVFVSAAAGDLLSVTLECLESLQLYTTGIDYEVIVVDDGSAHEAGALLTRIENLRYLRNEANRGFVLSCNRGADAARGQYLVFLNNDAQVTPGWLPALLDSFSRGSAVGAVGPKMLYPNGRLQEAGVAINADLSVTMVGVGGDPRLARYNYMREVHYCSGACLMIARQKFIELGGFSATLSPGYCEDLDLALRLRARGLRNLYNPDSTVIHHLSLTNRDARKTRHIARNSQLVREQWGTEVDAINRLRLIAFYLPQYHPFPENEFWWGEGFTEWANVTKARANFQGHYQPHLPADLGFYDLRVPEVMDTQAELAREYGIYGFCYFYYWFAGKRLMEMPVDRILATGRPQFPFCLAWANENWTRRWDGNQAASDAIMVQEHSDDDDRAVIRDLMRYMRHPQYIRIDGKPILLVYRINLFPHIARTAAIWRDTCRREGLGEIYLVRVESFEHAVSAEPPATHGFDAAVEYLPHHRSAPLATPVHLFNKNFRGVIHDYEELVLQSVGYKEARYTHFRGVMPSWDNTPRQQDDGVIFARSSPGAYQAWLEAAIQYTHEQNVGDERLVFINAWNEWAEGAHLEPDRKFGRAYLEATRNALQKHLLRHG
ncbi:MAG: glycoside hydrolase family 99-like domain-containing protein [Candidatus Binatia bacterium]